MALLKRCTAFILHIAHGEVLGLVGESGSAKAYPRWPSSVCLGPRQYGLAMLFISHDLAVVGQASSRVAVMRSGYIVETGHIRDVLLQLQHEYTRSLLAAVPTLRTDRDRPLAMTAMSPRRSIPNRASHSM